MLLKLYESTLPTLSVGTDTKVLQPSESNAANVVSLTPMVLKLSESTLGPNSANVVSRF